MNSDIDTDTIDQLNEAFSRVTYQRDFGEFSETAAGTRTGRRKTWLIVAAATATAAALTTGGMAAARRGLPDAVSYARDVRSTEQAEALVDDEVTLDEYKAGFQRFSDCMEHDGRPLGDVAFNETTQLYNYSYDGIDDCYEQELYALDVSWQLSDARPRDPFDLTAQIMEACAIDDAAPPAGLTQENFDEICEHLKASQPPTP